MGTEVVLTVSGCSSSSGTPMPGCTCPTCLSTNPRNRRSRCSAHIRIGSSSWQIDTGPDFRQQALRDHIPQLDGVLYTHAHADHLNGIDDLRSYCYLQKQPIPIYGNEATVENIRSRFDYALGAPSDHWNRPVLVAHILPLSDDGAPVRHIGGVPVFHFAVPHGRWTTAAFRIGNVAWFTDLNDIGDETVARLQGLDYLFLDCLSPNPYPSHLSVAQALEFARRIGARQTYFIHMNHTLSYEALQSACPPDCAPAYDGLRVVSHWPG